MARRAATLATEILERHEARYGVHVGRVQLVLADVEDDPNGFASPLPYPLVQVRAVAEGETVGYTAAWTARRPSRVAILSLGYADGILRSASARDRKPGAEAIVAGHPCPFAGLISMDLLAVDVTEVPEDAVRRGALATLLGQDIGVDDLASHGGTIGYEILTSLGRRYRRVYQNGR